VVVQFSPDEIILWQLGSFKLNSTIVTSWAIMAFLTISSMLVTRRLAHHNGVVSGWQSFLEIIVTVINGQIKEAGLANPSKYISFIGTIFLFIATSSIATLLPGYTPPTASLSTTVALALCVFFAVPMFGIASQGVGGYLKSYIQPTFIMLPFNIISEFSRTLAMAIRLFGNMMSGGMIVGILLSITPFLFPIVMTMLGLLTGMVQAYIFSILATVYIAAAIRSGKPIPAEINTKNQ
jgi:F-type H+-transporting ATPase subunit a